MAESDRKIAGALLTKELEALEIMLISDVERTAITLEEYIKMRLAQGVDPAVLEADLIKDLEEGGRIFGEFRNALKPTFGGATNRFRDAGELVELGLDGKWRWVVVSNNPCPDCLERGDEEAKTWNDWEAEGLPRTNATVCEQNCKCVMISEDAGKVNPIIRSKRG
jgi:hypothetical protein